jgi:hypothetical protein
MLHRPTEAQLKRQIAQAISYRGEICQHLSLFLCKGWTGFENELGADKGMQCDICHSIHLPMAWSSLFNTVWGSLHRLHTVLTGRCHPLGTHLEGTPVCWSLHLAISKVRACQFSGQISLLKLPKQMDLSSNMMPA